MTVTTRRIRAYILDQLIVLILIFFPIFMAAHLGPWPTTLIFSYGIVYAFLKDSVGGASIGKRAFSIHAIQPYGNIPIGSFDAAFRNFILFVPIFGLWDGLALLFGRHQSRISDRQLPRNVVMKDPTQPPSPIAFQLTTVLLVPVLFTLAVKGSPFPHPEKSAEPKIATIWDAAAEGNIEKLKDFIASGAAVNGTNDAGQTALQLAIVGGKFEAIRILLQSGADVCAKTNILKPGGETVSEILQELITAKGLDTDLTAEQLTHLKKLIDSQKCGGKFDAAQFKY